MKTGWILWLVAGVLGLCLIWHGAARAHDWYPPFCCSGVDCAPIDDSRVEQKPDGYLVDGKHFMPLDKVRKSEDGRFHGCFPQPDNLFCFFAPPQGS